MVFIIIILDSHNFSIFNSLSDGQYSIWIFVIIGDFSSSDKFKIFPTISHKLIIFEHMFTLKLSSHLGKIVHVQLTDKR